MRHCSFSRQTYHCEVSTDLKGSQRPPRDRPTHLRSPWRPERHLHLVKGRLRSGHRRQQVRDDLSSHGPAHLEIRIHNLQRDQYRLRGLRVCGQEQRGNGQAQSPT